MKLRIANIRFGFTALFITACIGGMALGSTFNDHSVQDGNHLLGLARFYMREGHSHGNFMSFFNIFVGLVLENLRLGERWKTLASYAAMAAILLPVGLFIKGATGFPEGPSPIGLVGIVGISVALLIIIAGAFRTRQA